MNRNAALAHTTPAPTSRAPMQSGVVIANELRDWADASESESTRSCALPERPVVLEPGCRFAGRYELVRQIGSGGMSSVWEAVETLGNGQVSIVAIKIVNDAVQQDPVEMKRFEHEARLAQSLAGPGMPRIRDYGVWRQKAFMVMDLLVGEDLQALLDRRAFLSPWECLSFMRPLARALDSVHACGVVHRDIKCRNVFFAREGQDRSVKLLDFGLAKHAVLSPTLTRTGFVLGSPAFMSPEQARSSAVDHRSDLWSLAVLLYRALSGAQPFTGSFAVVLRRITAEQHRSITSHRPELPVALDAFFDKALAKSPSKRFQSAIAMVEAFEKILLESDLCAIASQQTAKQDRVEDLTVVMKATPEGAPVRPPMLPRGAHLRLVPRIGSYTR